MLNLKFNTLIIITLSVLLLFSLTNTVCAQENNTNNMDDVIIQGTYGELEKEINNLEPGETITLTQDYQYNEKEYNSQNYIDGITIHKNNITINGNNHTINSKNKASFFKITGDNVNIKNLNMINSQKKNQMSILDNNNPYLTKYTNNDAPITWIGNNGTLYNCTLQNNTIINNGILKIQGQYNNIINNTFQNNNILKDGAQIYIKNKNNQIQNCIFENTTPHIYIYNNTKNNNNNSIITDTDYYSIDLDLDYLNYKYKIPVADYTRDLVEDIYQTLSQSNTTIKLNDLFTVKGTFNGREYLLTYNKDLGDNIIFAQEYYIKSITKASDIYNKIFNKEYITTYTLLKNIQITGNIKDYENLLKLKVSDVFSKNMMKFTSNVDREYINLGLNINLNGAYTFNSNTGWHITDTGFDFINLNANGSTIKASTNDTDECTWLLMDHESGLVNILNLTVTGFNTGIDNRGIQPLTMINVVITNNKKDYNWDMDYGAGMINTGNTFCYNCTFTSNYAKHGGAIFNQGNIILENCTFKNNKGYGTGDNILNAQQGNVTINGVLMPHNNDNTNRTLIVYEKGWDVEGAITGFAIGSGLLGLAGGCLMGFFVPGLGAITSVLYGGLAGLVLGTGVGCVGAGLILRYSFDVTLNRQQIALKTIGFCVAAGCVGGMLGGGAGYKIKECKNSKSTNQIDNDIYTDEEEKEPKGEVQDCYVQSTKADKADACRALKLNEKFDKLSLDEYNNLDLNQKDELEIEYSDLTTERIGETRCLGMDLKAREGGLGEANLGKIDRFRYDDKITHNQLK